jgi:hypothetical protein
MSLDFSKYSNAELIEFWHNIDGKLGGNNLNAAYQLAFRTAQVRAEFNPFRLLPLMVFSCKKSQIPHY